MTSSDPTTVTECEPETVVGRRHGPTPFPYSHHEVSTPLRPWQRRVPSYVNHPAIREFYHTTI